ncbi:protein AGENET DOMAIN (AGD)-CONTAINING P1 [Jatropha curcas]|uniref:protein AGENET DOMAIN (AGD)-CONTAINING P1 n=1 Tax=Jatropha curcas TaxID=180498 RepID=UPI0005FAB7D8|nr:protein AGENET DOMAIN (AGD)-CONTAINING P1 [Jatropha curcas]
MSHLSYTHFNKGDQVEVLKRENGPSTFTYYGATVLRSPAKQKTQILVEYHNLVIIQTENQKHFRELVDLSSVRPMPPRELNECFKMEDSVDVFCDNGWQKGTVKDILENSTYIVGFDGKSEGIVAEQNNLRLHREWDDGSWVPPLTEQKTFSLMGLKSGKIKLKIKCNKRKSETMFRPGTAVEVKSDEEGYIGAWYGATIIGTIGNDKFLVQYLNLVTDDETAPLREVTDIAHVRPFPPCEPSDGRFKQFEKVDAWFNEGWWEGEVSGVLNESKYMVYFSTTKENLEFHHSVLRHHQEWISGKWIKGESIELERHAEAKFCIGTKVEVKSDEVGFQGAWFSAVIISKLGNDKFVVQYHSLLTDDGSALLREVASASNLRPFPPSICRVYPFKLSEMVDAWYNDGWWVGRIVKIVKIHEDLKYIVQFKTREELEFAHSELRPHQEWIDENWFAVPKDWEF